MSPSARDDAPGGQRHGVLVDELGVMLLDARGAQRQRAAERPAQVVSLRQLAGVEGQQRARPRQERDIEASLIVGHRRDPMAPAAGFRSATRSRDNPGIEKSPAPYASRPGREARLRTGGLGRAADWIVPAKNPARVVYGIITVGALMAAESGRHESYADLIGSAFITTGLYWLLHAYSSVLGHRLATGERLTPAALSHGLVEEWAIVRGAAIPLLALVIAWVAGGQPGNGRRRRRCGARW